MKRIRLFSMMGALLLAASSLCAQTQKPKVTTTEVKASINTRAENYAEINSQVAAMPDAIQPVPPTPQFDDLTAEDAASLRTPLGDTFEVWADAFITGKKSTDTDWDAYVAEMKNLSIDEYLQMYNDNK